MIEFIVHQIDDEQKYRYIYIYLYKYIFFYIIFFLYVNIAKFSSLHKAILESKSKNIYKSYIQCYPVLLIMSSYIHTVWYGKNGVIMKYINAWINMWLYKLK